MKTDQSNLIGDEIRPSEMQTGKLYQTTKWDGFAGLVCMRNGGEVMFPGSVQYIHNIHSYEKEFKDIRVRAIKPGRYFIEVK